MTTTTHNASGIAPSPLIYALSAFAEAGIGQSVARAIMANGTVPSIQRGSKLMIRAKDFQRFIETMPSYRSSKKVRTA